MTQMCINCVAGPSKKLAQDTRPSGNLCNKYNILDMSPFSSQLRGTHIMVTGETSPSLEHPYQS